MVNSGSSNEEPTGKEERSSSELAAPASSSLSLRLLLWGSAALALSILVAEGDGMPGPSAGEEAERQRLARAPEVSPYRGDGPFTVHNTTHGALPFYAHTRVGWSVYLASVPPILALFAASLAVFGRDTVRILQIFELSQTVGMISGGSMSGYLRYPVPTAFHGTGSSVAALTRRFLFGTQLPYPFSGPVVVALLFGCFKRLHFLFDGMGVFYSLLDMWPSLIGEFHVNERPTHNLRLLVLSIGSMASRHRAWGGLMGLFYIGTGGPKLFPHFYRYWLWFGIYPSSTLSNLPPSLFFERGEDGGWHPNILAQAFGFCGGALETAFAVLILVPIASTRRLRALVAAAIHLAIIFGRFDNGLCGWNSFWLIEDLVHSLGPVHSAGWSELSPLAATVLAGQGALELLFFLGHGSYHSGQSHHTGNFRMQWLAFSHEGAWQRFEEGVRRSHGEVCQHGPLHGLPTCVDSWGHGTHYPTASFATFLYALNGGTYLQEVLHPAMAWEPEGYGPNLERLGEHALAVVDWLRKERTLRVAHHEEHLRQVDALVGGFQFNASDVPPNRPRALYLGFASGASIWDDSFYEPLVANVVRGNWSWRPGEVFFVELDRQRPWRSTRRLRVWDLSQDLPETPRSLVDKLLGSSPRAHLLEERRLVVRRPFPFT